MKIISNSEKLNIFSIYLPVMNEIEDNNIEPQQVIKVHFNVKDAKNKQEKDNEVKKVCFKNLSILFINLQSLKRYLSKKFVKEENESKEESNHTPTNQSNIMLLYNNIVVIEETEFNDDLSDNQKHEINN